MGVRFTEQIAKCLYTGIATDTGCFKFSNCNADTHIITGKLMAEFPNIKYADINRRMFDVKSVSRIKTEREALDNITYYLDGKVAVVYVSYDMIQRLNISLDDFEGLTGLSTQTEGVEVGITLKESEKNTFKVSLRSVGYVNVSEICQAFGGGGHIRASGCKFSNTTANEVITKLVDKISEVL
jgi:phosphoesterase RecJ-like protein